MYYKKLLYNHTQKGTKFIKTLFTLGMNHITDAPVLSEIVEYGGKNTNSGVKLSGLHNFLIV